MAAEAGSSGGSAAYQRAIPLEISADQSIYLAGIARHREYGDALVPVSGQRVASRTISFMGSECLDGSAFAGASSAGRGVSIELVDVLDAFELPWMAQAGCIALVLRFDPLLCSAYSVRVGSGIGPIARRVGFG